MLLLSIPQDGELTSSPAVGNHPLHVAVDGYPDLRMPKESVDVFSVQHHVYCGLPTSRRNSTWTSIFNTKCYEYLNHLQVQFTCKILKKKKIPVNINLILLKISLVS
jgi:hypothetical protein